MKCPLCLDQELEIMHRAGVEIDICPQCRGIWLDRGELERLARPAEPDPSAGSRPRSLVDAAPRPFEDRHHDHRSDGRADDVDEDNGDGQPGPKSRKSEGSALRSGKSKDPKKKKRKKKSTKRLIVERLGDALEEVLDL